MTVEGKNKSKILAEVGDRISSPDTSTHQKFTVEAVVSHADVEDNGQAIICDVGDSFDHGMFVQLKSFSEKSEHPQLLAFIGRRVRITVETI